MTSNNGKSSEQAGYIADKLAKLLDRAIMGDFRKAYGGAALIERVQDGNGYHMVVGALEIAVYLDGANIVTELKHVPSESAEDALIGLLRADDLFTIKGSPFYKKKRSLERYTRLFERYIREEGDLPKMVYVPKEDVAQAKNHVVIDTIVGYMLNPTLLLLPNLSARVEALHSKLS